MEYKGGYNTDACREECFYPKAKGQGESCVDFRERGVSTECVIFTGKDLGQNKESEPNNSVPTQKEKRSVVVVDNGILVQDYSLQPTTDALGSTCTTFYSLLSGMPKDQQAEVIEDMKNGKVEIYSTEEKPHLASYALKKMDTAQNSVNAMCISELPDSDFEGIAPGFAVKRGCTYYIADEEKPRLLFRGRIYCDEIRCCIDRTGDVKAEEWHIRCVNDENKGREKWIENINVCRTLIKEMRIVPGVTIEKGAEQHIINLLSLLAKKAKHSLIYVEAGWQIIHKKYCFLYDGKDEKINIRCGKSILIQNDADICNIFRCALKIFNDQTLAGPMILYSMYGIMYLLFAEAGYRPTMILFISGHSGTLKTSTAKVLYRMWNTDTDEEIMSFQSTAAAIEPVIKDCYDSVFLIDDYCVNAVQGTGMKRDMAKNLDIFLRYYGDSISRKKSNLFGELISAPRPRGGAVVTGEICASGESSLLRTLTIIIPKGGINGEALAVFQNNKNMWASFLGEFISFVEKNFAHIVAMIRSSYEQIRKNEKNQFAEKRSVDHWAELILINDVLRKFLISQGMRTEEADSIGEIFIQGVKSWIKSSEQIAQKEDPRKILLEAMLEAIDSSLKIAPSGQDFKQRIGFDGYFDTDGKARISKKKFVKSVNRTLAIYNQSVDRLGLSWKGIPKMLHEEYGIISIFQNGGKNRCYTSDIKLSDGHKENAYVMNVDLLREIVESNA